jgi:hypothetical protein
LEGTSIAEVACGSMDASAKPFGVFFNLSFGASEYASKDFFLLLGGFLASITCYSSKICKESNKEESNSLATGFNSLETIESTRRVSKGSENNFY